MKESGTQRFNLIFRGQLLPGTDPERAKRALAAFFGLRDAAAVTPFFSGKPVPLRRNLTDQDAQRLYRQLRSVGLICELLRVIQEEAAAPQAPPVEKPIPKANTPQAAKRSRQPAEQRGTAPNLFAMRPAPAPQALTALRESIQIRGMIAAAAALSLAVLVIVFAFRLPTAAPGKEPVGPLAMTSLDGSELVLLLEGALLIHERSGLPKMRISAADLGFEHLAAPLLSTATGELIFNAVSGDTPLRLQRCSIVDKSCYPFNADILDSPVVAVSQSMLGDSLFVLSAAGQLWRNNAAGEIEAQAQVPIPWGQPRLLASGGLLLLPASDGPLLGVFRPDQQNFGQQLDALLLMPQEAAAAGQDRIQDIAASADERWALLAGDGAAPGLFKFDGQWGAPVRIPINGDLSAPFLQIWRNKLLLADPGQMSIQRFADNGQLEAPFESELLAKERSDWLETSRRRAFTRKMGMVFPGVLGIFCTATALLYLLGYRATTAVPAQTRSALLDPMPGAVQWLRPAPHRESAITGLGVGLLILTVATMLGFGLHWGWPALLAGLPMLAGSLFAWHKLKQGSGGHLGLLTKHIIVVDYDGRYFFGERSALRGTSSCLLAPGVALPIGLPPLRNMNTDNVAPELWTPAKQQQCSNAELFGALWLQRHPWVDALLAFVGGSLLSALAWLLLAG